MKTLAATFLVGALFPLAALASEGGLSASIGPKFAGDQVIGFEFKKIDPKSEWANDGLRDGDVVLSINGQPTKKFGTSTIDFESLDDLKSKFKTIFFDESLQLTETT